ncbi:hypothetical protein T548_0135 [Lactococcus phage phiL47]|uniref:Uncharacterized protein n=1 Tax=Lactococcus phage phiL47 TaxID=1412875 RepID=V9VEY1_9CAUD|nr:HNH endonuclease [Lactococcus phage phiL47]AHC94213.1 hypothetical protein T548_0135 [Lactococcus phage phiL47]
MNKTFINKRGHEYSIISEPFKRNSQWFVGIRFTDTGSIRFVRKTIALAGQAKDMYAKDVYGVGCKGDTKKVGNERQYQIWRNMLSRCYVERDEKYHVYGGAGITVAERWLCFENFVNDLPDLLNYDEELFFSGKLQLDKDLICEEEGISPKIYSKDTCLFLTHKENIALQRGKSKPKSLPDKPIIKATNIETGEEELVYDVVNYCKEKGLGKTSIYRRLNGETKNKSYKGFIFERI